jgi:hypothetical protein
LKSRAWFEWNYYMHPLLWNKDVISWTYERESE